MTAVAGERHRCEHAVAQPVAATCWDELTSSATVTITSTHRTATEQAGCEMRNVRSSLSHRRCGEPKPGAWRDACPWDAQLVPEGAKRGDRRPSSDLDAMQRVSGTCTTGAVSSLDFAGLGYEEAATPL
jgi:hypothetical protein